MLLTEPKPWTLERDPIWRTCAYRPYAGIGSRETPDLFLFWMAEIGFILSCQNWTLRSGAAPGADSAFEIYAMFKEIFVPWDGFEDHPVREPWPDEAYTLAMGRYGAKRWKNLSQGIQKLQARNIQQVLGAKLDNPSKFVLCWTQDGAESHDKVSLLTGGTGTAIWVASQKGIPVINMQNPGWQDRLCELTDYDFSYMTT